MGRISRREVLQLAATVAATGGGVAVRADSGREAANPPRRPKFVVAERVPERCTSLPFEAQELHGLFAERMRINVEGRLLHIDEQTFLSAFTHRNGTGDFDGAWVGEHAGKFLEGN